jgi:GH15 family glucan-1,4-alpha-glucosidase
MDGSIWQYNLEWVRDQSHVAEAFLRLGDPDKARVMLSRLLERFVSPEGDTVDSGRRRPAEDVELDQNGTLLSTLAAYLDWTGDRGLLEDHWDRIRALADFPFEAQFLHLSAGLLHNCREYWERHEAHGIRDGFELMSQFAVAMGLEAAAHVAADLDRREDADRWADRARRLKVAMLEDPRFRLVEEGHLIKRRRTDGTWQRTITLPEDSDLPSGVPLHGDGLHLLDPDTSAALAIAHGFIPSDGELALGTLAYLETLWNQFWEGGGYGRYNATSEPDSPGAWPFASLFVARAYAESGDDEKVWRILRWLQETQGGRSGAWFENDGPRISPPYPQVGITPWTWAEIITLFVHHFLGFRPHGDGILIRPRLLAGLESMEASLRVRGRWIHLRVEAATPGQSRGGRMLPLRREGGRAAGPLEGIPLEFHPGGFRIPYPDMDLHLHLSV